MLRCGLRLLVASCRAPVAPSLGRHGNHPSVTTTIATRTRSELTTAQDVQEQGGTEEGGAVSTTDQQDSDSSAFHYNYFKSLVEQISNQANPAEQESKDTAANNVVPTPPEDKLVPTGSSDLAPLRKLRPSLPTKSGNLASYVNSSETLEKLVQLRVDLSVVERDQKVANQLLKADFERDVKPRLLFLSKLGVATGDLGSVLTKNPRILTESMTNMEARVNYFESKTFSAEAIARIVTKAPFVLSKSVEAVDTILGVLQREFQLTGEEVRTAVTRLPKITVWKNPLIQENFMMMQEFLGFTPAQQKQLLLTQPKVYLAGKRGVMERFDYVHNTMGMSHECVLEWPDILRTRVHIIRQRYQFLTSIGRAQLDPKKENFVSLKALVSGRDSDFCKNVAKVPVRQYNDFLKTQ